MDLSISSSTFGTCIDHIVTWVNNPTRHSYHTLQRLRRMFANRVQSIVTFNYGWRRPYNERRAFSTLAKRKSHHKLDLICVSRATHSFWRCCAACLTTVLIPTCQRLSPTIGRAKATSKGIAWIERTEEPERVKLPCSDTEEQIQMLDLGILSDLWYRMLMICHLIDTRRSGITFRPL